jgi:hypothetical protein
MTWNRLLKFGKKLFSFRILHVAYIWHEFKVKIRQVGHKLSYNHVQSLKYDHKVRSIELENSYFGTLIRHLLDLI